MLVTAEPYEQCYVLFIYAINFFVYTDMCYVLGFGFFFSFSFEFDVVH